MHGHTPCPATPSENLFVSVYRAFILGLSHVRQADLESGEHYYRQALVHAEQLTGAQSSGSATLTALLAELWYERGDWQALHRELQPRAWRQVERRYRAARCPVQRLPRPGPQCVHAGDDSQAHRLLEHAQQLATRYGAGHACRVAAWPNRSSGAPSQQRPVRGPATCSSNWPT